MYVNMVYLSIIWMDMCLCVYTLIDIDIYIYIHGIYVHYFAIEKCVYARSVAAQVLFKVLASSFRNVSLSFDYIIDIMI